MIGPWLTTNGCVKIIFRTVRFSSFSEHSSVQLRAKHFVTSKNYLFLTEHLQSQNDFKYTGPPQLHTVLEH